jgi:hypothetical protein
MVTRRTNVLSPAPPLEGGNLSTPIRSPRAVPAPLRVRRLAARRRRLVMRVRDWLGISVIACFSLTLFALTFFSLLGR